MSLIATDNGTNIDPIPEGVHIAVNYAVVDLGTQESKFGKARKVLLIWELPEQRIQVERDGQQMDMPRAISARFTLSLNEKASLRKCLESWRGRSFTAKELKGFDLAVLLGKPLQIQVMHATSKEGREYAKPASFMALPRGMQAPKPENEAVMFSLDDLDPENPAIPGSLPDWVKQSIMESREWCELEKEHNPDDVTGADVLGDDDDNMPF
jgi:hypothetical protein